MITRSKKQHQSMEIMRYLDSNQILFLDSQNRNEALKTLVKNLKENQVIEDEKGFFQAILEREKIVSTGIGMGIAIPHAKRSIFKDFFLTIGIQKEKGLEWGALDKAPVRLVFLIGGPEDRQTEYLQILSCLTHFIREPSIRKELLFSKTPDDVVKILQNF